MNVTIIIPRNERKLEIVIARLSLFHGIQVTINASVISSFRRNGKPRSRVRWQNITILFLGSAKNDGTPSWSARAAVGWWLAQSKWGAAGLQRRLTLWRGWQRQRLLQFLESSVWQPERRTRSGGELSWRWPLKVLSQRHWFTAPHRELTSGQRHFQRWAKCWETTGFEEAFWRSGVSPPPLVVYLSQQQQQ